MKPETICFDDLLLRFKAKKKEVIKISLKEVLEGKNDSSGVVAYLKSLGMAVASLSDLLKINDDEDEEELFAHACIEGIAISHQSDGLWFLFTE